MNAASLLLDTARRGELHHAIILLTRTPDLLLPTIRSRSQPIYIAGEAETNDELAAEIVGALTRFAENRDIAALLGMASLIAAQDDVSDSIALLGNVLCDAVA